MEIRVVSTLTSEDERAMAPVLLDQIITVLERLPISYAITIAAGNREFRRCGRTASADDEERRRREGG